MQRYITTALIIFAAATSAWAQKTTTYSELIVIPHNSVAVNLGGLALDFVNLSYFHSLGESHGIGAYLGYLYHPVGSEQIKGYGYGISYRYYPAAKSLARFYYSPSIGIQQIGLSDGDLTTGVFVSGMMGWQWYVSQHFGVGLGIGARVIFGNGDDRPVLKDAFGTSPSLTLDLGYGW
ncbi:MAG: hypothetical protein JWQ98_999 [Chlorobi bacterium]|nr:hypothetical protein [Chlorobiota bacterium]